MDAISRIAMNCQLRFVLSNPATNIETWWQQFSCENFNSTMPYKNFIEWKQVWSKVYRFHALFDAIWSGNCTLKFLTSVASSFVFCEQSKFSFVSISSILFPLPQPVIMASFWAAAAFFHVVISFTWEECASIAGNIFSDLETAKFVWYLCDQVLNMCEACVQFVWVLCSDCGNLCDFIRSARRVSQ